MRERIEDALKGRQADYIEIRIESADVTALQYRGRDLESVGRTTELGGSIRALVRGGWGFVSVNNLDRLGTQVDAAIEQARLAGTEESRQAPVESVQDTVRVELARDPRSVSLADKKALLDEYNGIMWSAGPRIQTSVIRYHDVFRTVHFATSEGTYIEQEKADVAAVFLAAAREGDDVQTAHLSVGSSMGFGVVENRHEDIADVARRAIALLSARPVKGGTYTVIVDPQLSGIFAHEAFGHLSEADHVYENDRLRELMVLGKRFAEPALNILDGAAVAGHRGSYKYDDEGVPAQDTYLLREGVLVGRLHSRETAGKLGEKPTGNARALNYRFAPIVRMTNTYIARGAVPLDQMMSGIGEGLYVKDSRGGETSMEMFTFSAAQAFMIRNGRLAEEVRNVNLTGNLFETLANIEAVGDDFSWGEEGGGCGKGGQSPLPVAEGGPHLRIRNVIVGGE